MRAVSWAWISPSSGDLEAGVEQLDQARRIAQAVGKVDDVARAFAVLSSLLDAFGELQAAVAVALDGADEAAESGARAMAQSVPHRDGRPRPVRARSLGRRRASAAACVRRGGARASRDVRLRPHRPRQLDVVAAVPAPPRSISRWLVPPTR